MKRNRETGFLFILQAKWFSFYFYFFISLTLHQKDDKNFIYQRRCPYICLIRIVISKNYVILDLSSNEVLNIWKRSACFHYGKFPIVHFSVWLQYLSKPRQISLLKCAVKQLIKNQSPYLCNLLLQTINKIR